MNNLINEFSTSLFIFQTLIILHLTLFLYCFYLISKNSMYEKNNTIMSLFTLIVIFFIPILGSVVFILKNKKYKLVSFFIFITLISCNSEENKIEDLKDENVFIFKDQKEADEFFAANKEFFPDVVDDFEQGLITPNAVNGSSEFTEVINDKRSSIPATVQIMGDRVILIASKSYRGTFQSLNIELNMRWANKEKTRIKGDNRVSPNVNLINSGLNISKLEISRSHITHGSRGGNYYVSGKFVYKFLHNGLDVMTRVFNTSGTWTFSAENGKYSAHIR